MSITIVTKNQREQRGTRSNEEIVIETCAIPCRGWYQEASRNTRIVSYRDVGSTKNSTPHHGGVEIYTISSFSPVLSVLQLLSTTIGSSTGCLLLSCGGSYFHNTNFLQPHRRLQRHVPNVGNCLESGESVAVVQKTHAQNNTSKSCEVKR
jgi:hypothetical protein